MAETSTIEWTDATWTPVRARHRATGKVGWHCEHASPGCAGCYSEAFNAVRLGTGLPYKPGHRADVEHFLDEAMLRAPLRWRRPRRIFVCSMTDLFGDWVPDAWIDRVFGVMALRPFHTFQVLTKRSARMRAYLRDPEAIERICRAQRDLDPEVTCYDNVAEDGSFPLPNVWLGVSAEDQRRADERVPDLLATPAAVRFVSAEPLLGPVDLTSVETAATGRLINGDYAYPKRIDALTGWAGHHASPTIFYPMSHRVAHLDWVIAGGESGAGARPMHPDWARSLRDQCAAAGVPFHFKQWGAWHADALLCTEAKPGGLCPPPNMKIGKKAAGRLLDGVEHNGMPEVAS